MNSDVNVRKIGITTDCVCDLPNSIIEEYGISMIYFYISTENGCFKDRKEITSDNVLEHLVTGGKKAAADAPPVSEYADFFKRQLRHCSELIHITISSGVSHSYANASEAAEQFDGRVHVFDSYHLSTGMGHVVIKACEMRAAGRDIEEILTELTAMRECVSTSFIAYDTSNLYRNGLVGKTANFFCNILQLHPVLTMKHGSMVLQTFKIGNYRRASLRYVRNELKKKGIDRTRLLITHAGCSVQTVNMIEREAEENCSFDEVQVTKASATITCNCGGDTFGLLFVRKNDEEEKS